MPTPSVEEVRAWVGRSMIDSDGKQLGEITDIYLDRETDRPEWAVVRTGLFGLRSSFVPLAEATHADDRIQVPHERTLVKDAPNIEADGQLSEAEEAELYRHYGMDYEIVTADGDQASSQAGGSTDADQPTAPPLPSGDAPAAVPTAGPVEHQSDDKRGATAPMASAPAAAEEGFAVGEGMSRPFVYETPGSPQGGPGGRRRQPGQVRLRRYLVTEVVTETETGQQHELRVEQEPISDQEVDGVNAGPRRPEVSAHPAASDQPEPPTPDSNDWFRSEGDPPR
jgi:sporulation protein YlmC with PRC-barrel domain